MLYCLNGARRLPTAYLIALACAVPATFSASAAEESKPPGYTLERTGTQHDFDYFEGGWTTRQRRLKTRGAGADDWEVFPGNLCISLYLEGAATVDELYFPTLKSVGFTVRLFDNEKRQWSIYWATSETGRLDPMPVVGGFDRDRGEFYSQDEVDGRPVKVRYLWLIKDKNHAHWEQAFSYDDETWETNWTADFTRAETAAMCENGKPKR